MAGSSSSTPRGSPRRSFGELVYLAFLYAEMDRQSYSQADKGSDGEEAKALAAEFRAYRLKRWGRTKLEADLAQAERVDIRELLKVNK